MRRVAAWSPRSTWCSNACSHVICGVSTSAKTASRTTGGFSMGAHASSRVTAVDFSSTDWINSPGSGSDLDWVASGDEGGDVSEN